MKLFLVSLLTRFLSIRHGGRQGMPSFPDMGEKFSLAQEIFITDVAVDLHVHLNR